MTIPTYTPRQLLAIVRELPIDGCPISDLIPPPKCYSHHRHHWVGWVSDYCSGKSYYQRANFDRDAKFIYNAIQNVGMVIWLAEAAGCPTGTVKAASMRAAHVGGRVAQQCGAARQLLPWGMVAKALWPAQKQ
jgi:hypothetical protein